MVGVGVHAGRERKFVAYPGLTSLRLAAQGRLRAIHIPPLRGCVPLLAKAARNGHAPVKDPTLSQRTRQGWGTPA